MNYILLIILIVIIALVLVKVMSSIVKGVLIALVIGGVLSAAYVYYINYYLGTTPPDIILEFPMDGQKDWPEGDYQ